MPRAPAMGARVEQSGEFLPCARRARRRHLEDLADSLHRLPSAAEDLYVIVPSRNRALLLQGEFCITLQASSNRTSRKKAPSNCAAVSNSPWVREPSDSCLARPNRGPGSP